MAVSVIERKGYAIPAIKAGIANLLIRLKLMSVFKEKKFNCKVTILQWKKFISSKKMYLCVRIIKSKR